MATAPLGTVLHHLQRLIAGPPGADPSDEQLLRRFTVQRDPSAFAALVQRHGRLVWGVCRHALHHHDAEDAFQATFLVLAKKADSIRRATAVGSWLHGVAHRIALKVKRDAARRRAREEKATLPTLEKAPAETSLRELQTVLDEEVNRLPEKLRAPFVLCVLDGRGVAEAASLLGWKTGTVSGRLARARKELRRRLLGRGVSLGAALVATDVCRGATPPPSLARAAAEKAIAGVPMRVAVLVEGVIGTMFPTRSKTLPLLLVLGLLAAGTGILSNTGLPARETDSPPPGTRPADKAPPARDDKTPRITVRGRVLGPDGKPVAKVRLYWPQLLKDEPQTPEDVRVTQYGTTDTEGRFRVELRHSRVHAGMPMPLLAVADGYGLDWVDLTAGKQPEEVTLRLVKDEVIRGRVLSTEGKPVVGASVSLNGVLATTEGSLDAFLTAWKQEWQLAFQRTGKRLYLPLESVVRTTTDKEGRFQLSGVGAERIALLEVKGAGIAHGTLYVVGRQGFDPRPYNDAALKRVPPELLILDQTPLMYGLSFDYVAGPAQLLGGTVREAGTGKPVAGVTVFALTGYGRGVHAVTDAGGRYTLVGLPKRKEYGLHASPTRKSALIGRSMRVQAGEGLEPLTADIELARGIILSGRLIDRATGKGVRGGVRFVPLPDNKYFGKKAGYDSYRYERLMTLTDGEGRFHLPAIPGTGVLMAQAGHRADGTGMEIGGLPVKPFRRAAFSAEDRKHVTLTDDGDGSQYFTAAGGSLEFLSNESAVKRLDLAEGAGIVKCDLFLERGTTLTVHVKDSDGKPLSGTTVAGMTVSWPITFPLKEASCTVYALDPAGKPRRLVFYHTGRKLAGTLAVKGDEKEPPAVRLGPAGVVAGRLLDTDGQPLAGATVGANYADATARELERQLAQGREVVRTDKEGRFRLEGLVPGMKFSLTLRHGGSYLVGEPRIGLKEVAAGKTLDLGDVRVKPQ
ncbi:MAG: sigma-70 family RNA polymerase sigma factor [Planctomycetes bacterium]|nr:sigma-70 family RNA polymerase sigma factor [Planctomycetota bacterium]